MEPATPAFLSTAARLFNSGQARVAVIAGGIHDLFPIDAGHYGTLPELIAERWDLPDRLVLTYELNGPIRFRRNQDRQQLADAWSRWRTGLDSGDAALQRLIGGSDEGRSPPLEQHLEAAIGRPTLALELLRQCCQCSRAGHLRRDLVVVVEAADLILPDAPIAQLADADRQRLHICHDWFADPGFLTGNDLVVLLAESRSLLHQRIAQLPVVLDVAIATPDRADRRRFLAHLGRRGGSGDTGLPEEASEQSTGEGIDLDDLAERTAGLSLHALRQLWQAASHAGRDPGPADVIERVAAHIAGELGEDVVGFSRPHHRLEQVVGNRRLKDFLQTQLIPRLQPGPGALPGAAVAGPIGAGKTFIFEAVAAECGMPVLELKNIRSQWFGQTDVILERLRRVLEGLERVLIIVDEADTQFGGLGPQEHSTERRLTGKIQAMMSDPRLLGRVFWLLMTARIHRLSPDLRRPGRVGDLIIPVLDPAEPADRDDFLDWALTPAGVELSAADRQQLRQRSDSYSAAAYAALRRELSARRAISGEPLDRDAIIALMGDLLPPDIARTRRYQTLQALLNCTRRSLLPDPTIDETTRDGWRRELQELETQGIG